MPTAPESSPTFAAVRDRLRRVGQEHLLTFYGGLDAAGQAALLRQIAALDLEALPRLADEYVRRKPGFVLPPGVRPAKYYPYAGGQGAWGVAAYRAKGEDLIRRGKVAAFVVAGGQGSRLGFEGPKGCFPGGAVTGKPLFQIFAEGILATTRRYGAVIPWYVMTSPLNHEATVAFFEKHSYFGLSRDGVRFFPQGVMASMDMQTGKALLASRGEVATNPDGHGGCIRALEVSGSLAEMERRGIEHLCYFQVDNPIVRVIDPVFIGLHAAAPDSSGEMSSKMLPKASPEEKVGVFCEVEGRTEVIEYSDLPRELAERRKADGSLEFNAGSIAIHVMGVEFLSRLARDQRFELPWHRAEKKVAYVDLSSGETVQPEKPNAVKLEKFVFDALAKCRSSIVYETDRIEEFAPIKNATGTDSVESSRLIQTERAARWLRAAGLDVPRRADGSAECVLEVSPLTALEAGDLMGAALPSRIGRGASVAL